MKLLSFLPNLGVVFIAATLQAQNSDLTPRKPILPRAPALSSWTVTFKYKGENEKAPGAVGPSDSPRAVIVTKSNKTYWEQVTLIDGDKYEKWIFDDAQLKTQPGSSSILLVPPPSVNASERDYSDYQKSDFADLSWVSSQNFSGPVTQGGKPAFRFASGDKVAILSAETQLPLYYSDGETERFYYFNPAPTTPLLVPQKFLDVLRTHRRGVESLKYHPIPM